MKPDSAKKLRKGWTTGACATAAAKAAYSALLTEIFLDPVSIILPKGECPEFSLKSKYVADNLAVASIIKDAGDDPDVTHGAEIRVSVRKGEAGSGIRFEAGEGVGTITKSGLPLAVGEPAINPKPRSMISSEIQKLAAENQVAADVIITVSVINGEKIAEKTWNPRLGIVGGISILGTTGVVIPYSCSAWIHSIQRGIDVARANSFQHVAACTGSTSENTVRTHHSLPAEAMLDMGDFVGGMLKYFKKHPIPKLTIGGGFGKITKMAQGQLDLHSKRSQVDFEKIVQVLKKMDAAEEICEETLHANTANEVLQISQKFKIPLADETAKLALLSARKILQTTETQVEIMIVDRQGNLVGHAFEE